MKILKKQLSPEQFFLIFINLLPVYAVWFEGWPPLQVFFVYILESVVAGVLTLTKMTITGAVKKRDVWENNGSKTLQPYWLFLVFFVLHYGFFIAIQLSIFLSIIPGQNIGVLQFLLHFTIYIGPNGLLLLAAFIVGYGYKNLFQFLWSGSYRTASLNLLMFEPYARIFIQQFTVILGAFFLLFNGGKLFILVFALTRIVFEVLLNYERRIVLAVKRSQERSNSHS